MGSDGKFNADGLMVTFVNWTIIIIYAICYLEISCCRKIFYERLNQFFEQTVKAFMDHAEA